MTETLDAMSRDSRRRSSPSTGHRRHGIPRHGWATVAIVVGFLAAGGVAQQAAPSFGLTQWGTHDGLPQVTVSAIAESSSGVLWLGTFGGLVRYDGLSFMVYDLPLRDGRQARRIVSLVAAAGDRLLIGTEGDGLVIKDGNDVDHRLERDVSVAVELADGSMLAGTDRGLRHVQGDGTARWLTLGATKPFVVRCLTTDIDGHVWFGTENGVHVLDQEFAERFSARVGNVNAIAFHADGSGWVAASSGLYAIQRGATPALERLHDGPVTAFCRTPDGALWIATPSGIRRRDTVGEFIDTGLSLRSTLGGERPIDARTMFADTHGDVWIGTDVDGLIRVRPMRLQGHGSTSIRKNFGPVMDDGAGGLWVGSAAGLARLRDGVFEAARLKNGRQRFLQVRALAQDAGGRLWVGHGGRLAQWDPSTGELLHDMELGDIQRTIACDADGTVWVGGKEGVWRIDGEDKQRYTAVDGLASEDVYHLLRLSSGELWVATATGVSRWTGRRFESFGREDGCTATAVRVIHEGRDGAVWFGTYGAGLIRFKGGQFRRLTKSDGLPDDFLSWILAGPDGAMVLSANRGQFGVYERDLDAAIARHSIVPFVDFGPAAGLASNEAQGGVSPGGARTASGLWFPVVQGIVHLDLAAMTKSVREPVVWVDALRARGKWTNFDAPLALPIGSRDVSLSYAAANYDNPEAVSFRYRLTPRDEDWIAAGTRRDAFYTDLPPGRYEFAVQAARAGGEFSAAARIDFDMPARFVETAAFAVLVAVGILLTVIAAFWFSGTAARRRATTLERQVAARTADLRTEIDERRRIENELVLHRDELERRVKQRTAEFLEAQKLESVGRLAGGVAHDFNNLLTVIGGYADMAEEEMTGETAHAKVALEGIRKAASSGARLTSHLLAFARRDSTRPIVLNVNSAVAALLPILRRTLGEDVRIEARTSAPNGHVRIDAHRLDQVLLNLGVNARDAMPRGGMLTIETCLNVTESPHGKRNWIEVSVSDTGIGMDEATVARAFEPFFTTKPVEIGTGLGLASCHGIVHQAGGVIWISSTPGQGTVVSFRLPEVDEPSDVGEDKSPESGQPATVVCGTVLLVEDQESVRHVVKCMLESLGLTVLEAADGRQAVAIAKRRLGRPIDILLTDVVMPDAPGTVVAGEIRRLCPDVAVVFMSGYSADVLGTTAEQGVQHDILTKPFDRNALIRRLRRALDGRNDRGDRGLESARE